ncbi:MAG: hypothetical protein HY909_26020 [Deltaproteobacteria bacterium]|nr:hypothetical protein [Deltaproteobacteria bacterium]
MGDDHQGTDVLTNDPQRALQRSSVAGQGRVSASQRLSQVSLRVHPAPQGLLSQGDLCESPHRPGLPVCLLEDRERLVVVPLLAELDPATQESFDLRCLSPPL